MRPLILALPFLASIGLAACANVGDAPEAETTALAPDDVIEEVAFSGAPITLNADNTTVEWRAAKVTRSHDGGFSIFDGALYVEGDGITGIELSIEAASIFSDDDRLTGHLKNEDFFDVASFPIARFKSTSMEASASDSVGTAYTVTGVLTLRDQTNQISFPATFSVGANSVAGSADFLIDRQLWGLTYPGQPDDLIQDEVRIKLAVSALRSSENGLEEVETAD